MSSKVCPVWVCMLKSILFLLFCCCGLKPSLRGGFFYKSWMIFFINISRSRLIRILIVYCIWQKITQHFFFFSPLNYVLIIIVILRIIFVCRAFSKAPNWFARTAKQKENSKQAGHKNHKERKGGNEEETFISRDKKKSDRQNF